MTQTAVQWIRDANDRMSEGMYDQDIYNARLDLIAELAIARHLVDSACSRMEARKAAEETSKIIEELRAFAINEGGGEVAARLDELGLRALPGAS